MTAVTKKSNGIFIYPLKLILVPNFSSPGCLGAWLESVAHGRTDGRTDAQMPGENSANSGPAGLVPGPELSNENQPRAEFRHNINILGWKE